MTTHSRHEEPSSWAVGFSFFAAFVMLAVGVFQFLMGLVAAITNNFYAIPKDYPFDTDVTTYGWVHIVLGLALAAVGIGVAAGQAWARWTGIGVVCLSMVSNFLFIPYYPVWSIMIIGLEVVVIWALTKPALRR
jgi:vacuolar-type H+-ATPase subunit I/STV1